MMNASNASPRTGSGKLKLNGKMIESNAATLIELLAEQGVDAAQPGIAVAVNDAVIPRSAWPEKPVDEGDRIEVITAMQGG